MDNLPVLFFPQPTRVDRARRFGGGAGPAGPPHQRQVKRLQPQFDRLQQAMDKRRMELQRTSLGIAPEMVLVLETVGNEEKFFNVVRKIDGLEWLGETEVDAIAPQHESEYADNPDKDQGGMVFAVMSDQRALTELRNLFDKWKENPQTKFPLGLAPLKSAFEHLLEIRPWGAEDRMRETGIADAWRRDLARGQSDLVFEAVLWFRAGDAGTQAEEKFSHLVADSGGKVINRCRIEDIAYHAVLGQVPATRMAAIIEEKTAPIIHCKDMMFLRPVGQCAVRVPATDDAASTPMAQAAMQATRPQGAPVAALLDGLPFARH